MTARQWWRKLAAVARLAPPAPGGLAARVLRYAVPVAVITAALMVGELVSCAMIRLLPRSEQTLVCPPRTWCQVVPELRVMPEGFEP